MLVLGGPREARLVAELTAACPGAWSLPEPPGLRETFALVAAADGVVCNSSMLMHVAAAFGKPTVVLLGPSFPSARQHQAQWGYPGTCWSLGREAGERDARDSRRGAGRRARAPGGGGVILVEIAPETVRTPAVWAATPPRSTSGWPSGRGSRPVCVVPGGDPPGWRASSTAPGPCLLHYANYGYQPRGCPAWLVAGCERWRAAGAGAGWSPSSTRSTPRARPGGAPSGSRPRSGGSPRALARASDGARHQPGALRRHAPRAGRRASRSPCLPVFSTVGEPPRVPPLRRERRRRWSSSAAPGPAAGPTGAGRPALAAACRALGIEEIWTSGPPLARRRRRLAASPSGRSGLCPRAEVSELLLGARAGFLAYPAAFLPKSTIFAAYCAHGLLPVCAWPRPPARRRAIPARTGRRRARGGAPRRPGRWYRRPFARRARPSASASSSTGARRMKLLVYSPAFLPQHRRPGDQRRPARRASSHDAGHEVVVVTTTASDGPEPFRLPRRPRALAPGAAALGPLVRRLLPGQRQPAGPLAPAPGPPPLGGLPP